MSRTWRLFFPSDFANLDIVNTKSCKKTRGCRWKMPHETKKDSSGSCWPFFFFNSTFFIAIRCSRLQSRNPGCWSFKFGDLKFGPSLFHVKKPRFPRKKQPSPSFGLPSGPFLGFLQWNALYRATTFTHITSRFLEMKGDPQASLFGHQQFAPIFEKSWCEMVVFSGFQTWTLQ